MSNEIEEAASAFQDAVDAYSAAVDEYVEASQKSYDARKRANELHEAALRARGNLTMVSLKGRKFEQAF